MTNIPQEIMSELAQLKSYFRLMTDRFLVDNVANERYGKNLESLNVLSAHAFEAAKRVAAAAELSRETTRQCADIALKYAGSPVTDVTIAAVKAAETAVRTTEEAAAAAAVLAAAVFAAAAEHAETVSLHAAAAATAATRRAIDAAAEAAHLTLIAANTIRRDED